MISNNLNTDQGWNIDTLSKHERRKENMRQYYRYSHTLNEVINDSKDRE